MGQRRMRIGDKEGSTMYRSPNTLRNLKSRRLRWAGHVARMEEGRRAFKILPEKYPGNRPLGRIMSR